LKNLTINRGNNIKQGSKSKESQKDLKNQIKPAMESKEEEFDPESEKQEIDFLYNQRIKESYERHGFEVPDSVDYQEKSFWVQ